MKHPPAIPAGASGQPSKAATSAPAGAQDQAGLPPAGREPGGPASTPAAGETYPGNGTPPGGLPAGSPSEISQPVESGQPSPMHDYLAFFRGRAIVAAVVVLLILFSVLTLLVLGADLQPTPWDIAITKEIQELPYLPVGVLLIAVSQPGFQPWNWIIVIALMAVFFAAFRRPAEAIFLGLAGLGAAISEVVKNLVDRPRPTPDFAHVLGTLHSYSFPSGHVTGYTILYGFLFYLVYAHMPRGTSIRVPLLVFFAMLIVLVGPSRVYMGQHWASDTLAGYALGFAYLLLLVELYRFWLKRTASRRESKA